MERYFEINESGHNIRCKLYCREPRGMTAVVIFAHGFGGHKDNHAAARFGEKLLAKHKKAALLTFDWPCHGSDVKKKLTLEDCSVYLDLVVNYVVNKMDVANLYLYGTSFGGYLTLRYINEKGNPFKKIALRCPAINIYEAMVERIMEKEDVDKLSKGKDVQVGFDRKVPVGINFLNQLKAEDIRKLDFLDYAEDILILHGTKDEIIPFEMSREFADDQLIEFIPVDGADHRFRDPLKLDLSTKYILDFFAL